MSIQPVERVPVTVPTGDVDLLAREGFFLGIRAVTAFPTGVAFRLVIRVRDQNVPDGVDYRAICGHSINGSPPPADGLAVPPIPSGAVAVALIAAWPDQDVPETRLMLDLDAIRAAESRAVRV